MYEFSLSFIYRFFFNEILKYLNFEDLQFPKFIKYFLDDSAAYSSDIQVIYVYQSF